MLTKPTIVKHIVAQLQAQLDNLAGVSRAMHADASDEQNRPEDKYDTRGLETAYLASSQARQATETEQALAEYQALALQKFTVATPIALTALIELETQGDRFLYFLGPKAGGTEVTIKGREILVITPESPLGAQLLGRKAGEKIKLQTRGPAQHFHIRAVR